MRRVLFLVVFICLAAACEEGYQPQSPPNPHITPRVSSWEGQGNQTIGFPSESGVFRITWKSLDQTSAGGATFQLTLRSGISGRTIRTIADHRGTGAGTVDIGDDPRLYELLVDSSGAKWTITVEEVGTDRR